VPDRVTIADNLSMGGIRRRKSKLPPFDDADWDRRLLEDA
jgi:hypothetical protein